MASWLIMLIASVVFVGLFALGMSLTLIFKGHHIESEISTNPNMKKLGIKCVVEEAREAQGGAGDCGQTPCDSNCAGCGTRND